MREYDLIILGGGPAGCAAALRAAKLGMKACVIEKRAVGGVCLNSGCIPTKTLLRSASIFADRDYFCNIGVLVSDVSLDEARLYAHKDEIVCKLGGGIASSLKRAGVEVVTGEGKFISGNELEAAGETFKGKFVLIASGASPYFPPIKGIEYAYSSDKILSEPLNASDVCVIGGGVIGIELATYFSKMGRKVTIVEAADRILSNFPKELADRLALVMKKDGVKIITSAKVSEIRKGGLTYELNGVSGEINCGAVIAAIGRRANVNGLGLENAGINADGGFIKTDEFFRAELTGGGYSDCVYAVGDVNGRLQLAHFASASAVAAAEHMAGVDRSFDLNVVPACVYSSPELAMVGDASKGVRSVKYMTGGNGKMLINGDNPGFIKLYSDDKDVIVCAELFCGGASELIGEFSMAIKNRILLKDAAAVIHAHPTVYEAAGEAFRLAADL